jgi:hypothetical protein
MRPDSLLSLRSRRLSGIPERLAEFAQRIVARIKYPGGAVRIALVTDSPHLAEFFRLNWLPEDDAGALPDATIVAMRASARAYRLQFRALDHVRWFDRDERCVVQFGNESYTNLKVTVRGLVSWLGLNHIVWVHGCSMLLEHQGVSRGVIVVGRSGAGKTTLTAALRRRLPGAVQIVNDDWGPVSMLSNEIGFTGEQRLHMKYMSVATLRPDLEVTPVTHPSEHYHGDRFDPLPRLLISPSEVFGYDGLSMGGQLARIILLRRGSFVRPGTRDIHLESAVQEFERGEFSEYYSAAERFFNGSLFLHDDDALEVQRTLYRRLFEKFPPVAIGNCDDIEGVADEVLNAVVATPLPIARDNGG